MNGTEFKVAAAMSVPLCGWNPHWGAATAALQSLNIPLELAHGAWWDHGMANLFDVLIARGAEWALTIDYDSMFTANHLRAMFNTLAEYPDIDALAALQAKRVMPKDGISYETPIMKMLDGKQEVETDGYPLEVEWAHFGLTMIRLEALQRVPRPWFLHVPDSNGGYNGEDRIDPDIYFWNKWREAGNKVYVDPYVCIGHLTPMVLCFDDNLQVVYKHWVRWKQDETKRTVVAA